MENKVIIAGSRTIPERDDKLFKKIENILQNIEYTEIVSGTARGADRLGEWFAKLSNKPIKRFPADWNKHGRSAGMLRNIEMADYATHLIAVLDMTVPSKGTRNMIETARKKGLEVRVIKFYPE